MPLGAACGHIFRACLCVLDAFGIARKFHRWRFRKRSEAISKTTSGYLRARWAGGWLAISPFPKTLYMVSVLWYMVFKTTCERQGKWWQNAQKSDIKFVYYCPIDTTIVPQWQVAQNGDAKLFIITKNIQAMSGNSKQDRTTYFRHDTQVGLFLPSICIVLEA